MKGKSVAPTATSGEQVDLAGRDHWSSVHQAPTESFYRWEPKYYEERVLSSLLVQHVHRIGATTLLEIGCGDSIFLPYLARATNADVVAGLDYEPTGCDLTSRRLEAAGVSGKVHCGDVFEIQASDIGQFDLVYSLGVVEHFSDTAHVIEAVKKFVRPGGCLVTTVPNLRSIHGVLSWIWQPSLLAKHVMLKPEDLEEALRLSGFQGVHTGFAGLFSLRIVGWDREHRWPRLQQRLVPLVRRMLTRIDHWWLNGEDRMRGLPVFAPYLFAVGDRPESERTDSKGESLP